MPGEFKQADVRQARDARSNHGRRVKQSSKKVSEEKRNRSEQSRIDVSGTKQNRSEKS
jgi:hypothetical protein